MCYCVIVKKNIFLRTATTHVQNMQIPFFYHYLYKGQFIIYEDDRVR